MKTIWLDKEYLYGHIIVTIGYQFNKKLGWRVGWDYKRLKFSSNIKLMTQEMAI